MSVGDEAGRGRAGVPRVAILVATMRRPKLLTQLLSGLAALRFPHGRPGLQVVVVDNDPEGSAAGVCDAARAALGCPLRYLVEPRRGIPFARNAALSAVIDTVDFVAFIDDDEVPCPDWLDALLRAQARHDADVVAGPAESRLPEGAPDWVARGRLFDHTRHTNGAAIAAFSTANVLIAVGALRRVSPWFDERLALSGGSDRHFALRLHAAGCRMVWCEEARVVEDVPMSRARLDWLLARMYRQGICNGFCDIDLARGRAPRLRTGLQGALWIYGGLGLLPLGVLSGRHRAVRCMRYVAYGAGLLQSLRGRFYDEYRVLHGD